MVCRSSFSDFASKYGKDDRFKGIDKMREREGLFADYLIELRYKEKEESRTQKEKVRIKNLYIYIYIYIFIYLYNADVPVASRPITHGCGDLFLPFSDTVGNAHCGRLVWLCRQSLPLPFHLRLFAIVHLCCHCHRVDHGCIH